VDGDPRTSWVAAPTDKAPSLLVTLPRSSELTGVRLVTNPDDPVTRPTRVSVRAGGRRIEAAVPASGIVRFPRPVRTSRLTVTVERSTLRSSTDSLTGVAHLLPVGIAEVRPLGPDAPIVTPSAVTVPCRAGLRLDVDGTPIPLQVTAAASEVLAGSEVAATPCQGSALRLTAGPHVVSLGSAAGLAPVRVVLRRVGAASPPAGDPGRLRVRSWGRTDRSVAVSSAPGPRFLAVRENANAGWRATLHGRSLPAVTLDGWQQGWLLPPGASGTVRLSFAPQSAVDWGLLIGLAAALLLVAAAVAPTRRTTAVVAVDRTVPVAVRWAGLAVGLFLLGGWAGLAVAAVGVGAAAVAGPSLVGRARWLAPAVLAVAGLAATIRPAGSAHPVADTAGGQLLALAALAATVLVAAGPRTRPPRAAEPAQERPLEHVPGRGRGHRRGGGREQVERGEVTAEGPPPEPALDRDQ
jgi:arabinofuranan 3-O-arabinosyltransferase